VETTNDIDDWLSIIASGRCVGVSAVSTAEQYRRPEVVFRPIRDAEPIAVRFAWWRDDPHPATAAAVELAVRLYARS